MLLRPGHKAHFFSNFDPQPINDFLLTIQHLRSEKLNGFNHIIQLQVKKTTELSHLRWQKKQLLQVGIAMKTNYTQQLREEQKEKQQYTNKNRL